MGLTSSSRLRQPIRTLYAPNYKASRAHAVYTLHADDWAQNSHSAVHCASEIAYSHNCLLRGLNATVLQAPHVPHKGRPGYSDQDVKDLLFFVESWVKTVEHHHDTEEEVMFPEIEKMTGDPELLSGPLHQHKEFQERLFKLGVYVTERQTKPHEYKWAEMKAIIESFAPALTKHLYEEIDVILSLDRFDSTGLRKCFNVAEAAAKANGKIALLVRVTSDLESYHVTASQMMAHH